MTATQAPEPIDLISLPKAKVFVPHQPMMKSPSTGALVPKLDLSTAEEYGELIYLLDWPEIRDMDMNTMYSKLGNGLLGITNNDMVLMVGNPVAMALTAMIACDINSGVVNLLYWNKSFNSNGSYELSHIDLNAAEKFLPYRH